MHTPWTKSPEAAALLASCAATPPACHTEAHRYGPSVDYSVTYDRDDPRVKALADICERNFREVILPLHAEFCAGTATLTRDEILDMTPTVEEAIERAINGAICPPEDQRSEIYSTLIRKVA